MKQYTSSLEKYAGRNSRFQCPSCKSQYSYSRYVHNRTGKRLAFEFGRCNHEGKCGYHKIPNGSDLLARIKNGTKASYAISTTQAKRLIQLPNKLYHSTLSAYSSNSFVKFLVLQFGYKETLKLVHQFKIGTYNIYRDGCVFWLLDQEERPYGAQVVRFDKDGSTQKIKLNNGAIIRQTGWIHTEVKKIFTKAGRQYPNWLIEYETYGDKYPFPFGLNQLATESNTKPIAIVEAPKTAVICSQFFPEFIWLAIGALSWLNKKKAFLY